MKKIITKIFIISIFFFGNSNIDAQIHSGYATVIAGGTSLELGIEINEGQNLVTLTMIGPSDKYFAFGFDATNMGVEPYTIVMESNGDVTERKLGNHDAGTALQVSLNIVSHTVDAGVRTVIATRSIAGETGDHYTFEYADNGAEEYTTDIIFARGTSGLLSYHGSSNRGFSSITTVLPVKLSKFTVSSNQKEVNLDWTIESEDNLDKFEVQRSTNSKEWNTIYSISNDDKIISYHYTDKTPLPGINYYRLKQVDIDESYQYSMIRSIEFSPSKVNKNIVLFPTASSDIIHIETIVPFDKTARIQVLNSSFHKVKDIFWESDSDDIDISVSDIPNGIYYVIIKHQDWVSNARFIKQ